MRDGQRQLDALVEQALDDLLTIGRSLIDEGSMEVWNLVTEIGEIQTSPPFEEYGIVYGGFCSQVGRLAGVMATFSRIGSTACAAAESRVEASDQIALHFVQLRDTPKEPSERAQQHVYQLQVYVREFGRLGVELQRLIKTDVQFLVCDARVLQDHPELAQADALRKRYVAATDHLESLSISWWNIAEEAKKKASAYEASLAAYSFPHKIN